jgi:hypothetical protein
LHAAAGRALTFGAQHAFVDGVHFAVTVGAVLAAIASVVVYRYLPRVLAPEGALHGPVESLETVSELGLGGVPPAVAETETEPEELAERLP